MIWFTCKKCGKTHNRADSSAGTMIFCDCGHGNTVPWESTVAEPSVPPVVIAPKVPDLAPIQFDPGTSTGGPTPTPPATPKSSYPDTYPASPPPVDADRPTRRGRNEKRDPDFCFNHQRRPRVDACTDCEEGFCRDCLVHFQGALLCAPCKNFRARKEELAPSSSAMASASLVIPLLAGPLMMCFLINSRVDSNGIRMMSYLSLMPQVIAIGLGLWALREAESERKGGGQWVAITGIACAALTCLMMLLMIQFTSRLY